MSAIFSNDVNAAVSGTVDIGTMPEVEIKNDAGNPVPVSGPLTDVQLRATPVPVSFSTSAGVPTVTRVAVSTTVATLASASATRKRLLLFNESGVLFVKLGATATSTDYTIRMTANSFAEIDFSQTAVVTAIKASGNSDIQVTSID